MNSIKTRSGRQLSLTPPPPKPRKKQREQSDTNGALTSITTRSGRKLIAAPPKPRKRNQEQPSTSTAAAAPKKGKKDASATQPTFKSFIPVDAFSSIFGLLYPNRLDTLDCLKNDVKNLVINVQNEEEKLDCLHALMEVYIKCSEKVIVFCNSEEKAEFVFRKFHNQFDCSVVHEHANIAWNSNAINKPLIIATDFICNHRLESAGVVNFDVPVKAATYVKRAAFATRMAEFKLKNRTEQDSALMATVNTYKASEEDGARISTIENELGIQLEDIESWGE